MEEITMGTNSLASMNKFRAAMHEAIAKPVWMSERQAAANRWNPYSFEGGSVATIAGDDFVVAACDTRMSYMEFSVMTRDGEKLHVLNDNIILATSGFHGDVLQLKRLLEARLHKYRFDYRCDMTVDLCSELLARNLYYKRFFPYLTGAVLCGVDEKGHGAVYSYDPVGMIERVTYQSSGAAEPLIQPFLDNQILQEHVPPAQRQQMTVQRAVGLVKDAFKFVTERETSTGDRIDIVVVKRGEPITRMSVNLRED